MTVASPTIEVIEEAPATPKAMPTAFRQLTIRWIIVVAAMCGGFFRVGEAVLRQARAGDPIWYLLDMPLFAVIMGFGLQRRRGRELPIHDRQTDGIIATGLGLLLALIACLLQPRVTQIAVLARIGIVEAVIFLFAACVLCFGTRPVFRFWPEWLVLFSMWPVVFRLFITHFNGTPSVVDAAGVAYGTVTALVATGRRPWSRALLALGTSLILGILSAKLLASHGNVAREVLPGALAGIGGWVVGATDGRRLSSLFPTNTPKRPFALRDFTLATVICVLAGGAGLAFAPITVRTFDPSAVPELLPGATSATLVPKGWHLVEVQSWTWPTAYFGANASIVRYTLKPPTGSGLHESAIDVTSGPDLAPFSVYHTIDEYDYTSPVEHFATTVGLKGGIKASLDFTDPLQVSSGSTGIWVLESFLVKPAHGMYQRIAIISLQQSTTASNAKALPQPEAPFKTGNFKSLVSDLLRGQHPPTGDAPPKEALHTVQELTKAFLAQQSVLNQ